MALVDEEGGHLLARPRAAFLDAGGRQQDHEVRVVGMADEMLGAVDDEVVAVAHRGGLHAAQVRAGARLGHRQAVGALAAHARQQVALALLALQASRMFDGPPTQQ